MPSVFPGYVPPANLVIDAGVIYTGAVEPDTPVGTTRDGAAFDHGMDVRQVPYDGGHARYQGLDRITDWKPTLKAKFLTVTPDIIALFNPGSVADAGSPVNTITFKNAGQLFQTADYGVNLWLIGRQQVDGTLVRIHFPLFIATKHSIATKHNDEWLNDATLEPVLPAGSDPQLCPFFFEFLS
jgi:hypothetical protein